MTKPYLPNWATAQEAADWLHAETGEHWPLVRLVESGASMGVWLDCADDAPAEWVANVFQGRREGFMAPIVFAGDTASIAFVRDSGTLTMTRRPDGELLLLTPPARFTAGDLRFAAASVREIAAAVHRGASLQPGRRLALQVRKVSIALEDDALAAWLEVNGAALEGARIELVAVDGETSASAEPVPSVVAAAKTSKTTQAAERVAREDGRLRECEARGIVFDRVSANRLPDGVGAVAKTLNITRQSLSTDLKAALTRRFDTARNGKG